MIKIAFIQPRVTYYNGGDEKRCLKIIEETLKYTNYNIILYTIKIDDILITENYKNFIELTSKNDRLQIKELLVEKKYLFINENQSQDPNKWDIESFRFNSHLYKELEIDSPDVLWGFYLSEGFIRPVNIPAIHNQSGYFCDYVPVRESIFKQFDAVVCISKNVEQKWNEKMSQPFEQSYVMHSGSLVAVSANYKKDFNNDKTNILFAGRLIESKGVQDLIQALHLIEENIGEWHLNVVGSGPFKDNLIELADRLIPSKVSFIDFTSNINEFYKNSDLCIFPSHEFEGLMNVVIESMSFGCPVITTSGNGNEEIIEDGVDGYIIEPKNIKSLGDKISFVIANRASMQIVSNSAIKKIQNNFSWEKVIKNLDHIVKNVLNSNLK